MGDNAP
ncbi:c72239e8-03b9-46a2-88bf-7ec7ed2817ef [Thermothielavioides terrestris]|nr:c72239e8-03b9-46a2-88bf-7ec7ed2817ef [Thermothielavioides terrestris]